jgi:hypothetical protein
MNKHNHSLKATASAPLVICDTFLINRSTWLFRQNNGETHSIDSLSDVTHYNTEAEGVEF